MFLEKMKNVLMLLITFFMAVFIYDSSYAKDVLKVAACNDFAPFSFVDKGELVGFDIDFIKDAAKRLKFELEFVLVDSTSIIPLVASSLADIGVGGVSVVNERLQSVDFSAPYFDSGFVILTNINEKFELDINDLGNKKVGVYLASVGSDFLKNIKVGHIVKFGTYDNMLGELLQGGIDVIFIDMPYATYMTNVRYKNKLKITGPLYFPHSYGFVFQKNSPIKKDFDDVIETMRFDGTYKKIYIKWFKD